jgi:hypothetical protein
MVEAFFPFLTATNGINIIDGEHPMGRQILENVGITSEQLQPIVKLKTNRLLACEMGAGINQVGFTAVCASPEANHRFTLTSHQ